MFDLSVPHDYFTKRAKDLRSRAEARDPLALDRVRSVFNDASNKPDIEVVADLTLMRAQHVIAKEHGFDSWKALVGASGVEARLALTMARVAELNDFGIGIYGGHKDKTSDEKRALVTREREALRQSTLAVAATVEWLRENVEATRTPNTRRSSYGLKHIAEKDIGYITNGVFIAAGIIAGYPYKLVPGSPNVHFGMSEKSLKAVEARRDSPERALKHFTPRATEILARRGVQAFPGVGSDVELAWLEEGGVRTLRIGAIETSPFVVRLFVDHFTLFISKKAAKALGVGGGTYGQARPSRPKGEISILHDEVEAALEWVLTSDTRPGSPPPSPPPFETDGFDGWSYVWSKRAAARYAGRPKRDSAA